ncbi:unnamed protein product [Pneumocystis jirovecii]|uniref:Uncharacterized protein n=2 Tax=Pneumocystis jirovecii TaxID=42068 RepID=L0P9Q5_PNEJI|nr:uncharacterized protein T551_00836 [Pneumocystis jirovecii RU7]KTW32154.1 hypothetical protein T551_00836 [Pneumocystis jirovecii RU7]CCJ29136.1 unnamed protein product [Pneumocystis jirovecii]
MKQTWLDRVLSQKFFLYTFVGLVTLAVTFHLWSSYGITPDQWTDDILKDWLRKNHISFEETDDRETLLKKVKMVIGNV